MKTCNRISTAASLFTVAIILALSTADLAAQARQTTDTGRERLSQFDNSNEREGDRKISDRAITRVVQQQFETDYSLLADHLHVTTRDRVVTLRGRVPHLLARERAIDIAAAVPGVVAVESFIDVRPVQRSDAAVERDVEQALADDPAADSFELDVSVRDGVVTLSGTADSWQEKQLSDKIAKSVRGVKEVDNQIDVVFRRKRPDREIAADIRSRLRHDAHVDEALIDVDVENGRVMLSGAVATPLEKKIAVADAWVLNVREVDARDLLVDPDLRGPLQRAVGRGSRNADANSASEIARRLEAQLRVDPELRADQLNVRARNGTVTVTGQVQTLLERERVVDIALGVPGVRMVDNQIRVAVPERSDAEIRRGFRRALARSPAMDANEIQATVRNGNVILEGTTDSWVEREVAEEIAMSIPGVRNVETRIEVAYPVPRDDSEIESDISTRFQRHPRIDSGSIDIDVWNGIVALSGTVRTPMEKARALANAWVAGVRGVDTRGLAVDGEGYGAAREPVEHGFRRDRQLSDREIEEAIESALLYNPYVLSFRPEVQVRNGVVMLEGNVGSLQAKRAAEREARRILGAREVINRLAVQPERTADDREIEQAIRRAYLRDAVVESHDLQVQVRGGQVHLTGTVDSEFEKEQAEELALRVNGVIEVVNDLEVRAVPTRRGGRSIDLPRSREQDVPGLGSYGGSGPGAAFINVDVKPDPFFDYNFFAVKTDEEIREDIKDQLFWSPFVNDRDIIVTVQDGVATLRGTVDSIEESANAEANAYDGGAIAVRNFLRIPRRSRGL